MLSASLGLRLAPGPLKPRARLCRKRHVRSGVSRTALRCRALSEGRPHGSADEAALQTLMMKLREDDVEYFELKSKCREWGLGGKDNKDNLRAKLLRKVRQELGLPVFGPDNVPPGSVRQPQDMTPEELRHLFDSRGCMMPGEAWQALSMANALLVADGLMTPEEVIVPDEPEDDYSRMTVVELRAKCVSRKLSQVGLKQQLIQRLREYDAKLVAEAEEHAHFEAAAAEAGAAEGVAPSATNNAALHALQELFANMKNMEVAALREQLAQRHVNTQGTRQILHAKLTEELKKDVARALGGERRLAQWAASAVARMEDAEVLHELEVRQVAQFGSPEEARQVLQAQMQKDWVEEALHVQAVQQQQAAKQQATAAAGADGVGELGFAAVPARRLRLADFMDAAGATQLADMAVYTQLEQFLEEQQLPLDAAPRLAVRAEVAGSVLGGALVSGPRNALLVALELMQEFSVDEVLVEVVVPGARHFTCSVLATEQGAVALPPTELDTWDVEDDIVLSELALERHLAMCEGLDPEGVEALLSVIQQEHAAHPGYLGGRGRSSQQLRQSTPPAGMSAEATEGVRQASLALFQQLGLRDYAQFSGWVLPPRPEQDALAARLAAEQAQEQAAQEQQQRPRGKSFAELAAMDAELRSELEAAASTISAADRAAAVDTTAGASGSEGEAAGSEGEVEPSQLLAGELQLAEAEAEAESAALAELERDYGQYNGIAIDGSTRLTSEQAIEAMAPYQRPIPLSAPKPPVVEALQDLSAADPRQLCRLPSSGETVAFAQLSVVPDLGSPTSVLCQQAASVGLSQEALLRMLVSAAAVRGGAPALPLLPEAAAAADERAAIAEAAAAEAAAEAAAAAAAEQEEGEEGAVASSSEWAGDGSVWGAFAAMGDGEWDEQGIKELLDQPLDIASWGPAEEEGEAGEEATAEGGAEAAEAAGELDNPFQFVDATADPLLDPALAAQQQAAWEEQQAAEGLGLPYGYDEIREDEVLVEAASHVHVEDPADLQDGGLGGSNLEHMHPTKQRVWVLLGGDGPQRSQSLQAGLHAYLSLRQHPELLVEGYLLEPNAAGTEEVERRRRCLDRRLELRKMGFEEDWIEQEQTPYCLARIRNPAAMPSDSDAEQQCVWRLSDTGLLRAEVEDLESACEAALQIANANLPTLEDMGGDIAGMQLSMARQELELAGVPLDGSAWGGAPAHRLLPAQYMMLRRFAEQAQDCGAVVFVALGGQQLAHGPVQRLFEELGVPFTGCFSMQSELCADKATLREQQKISLPELVAQCGDEQSAARLFDQLLTSLAGGAAALCIKPATALGDPALGAMRAASGRDLMIYVKAVQEWAEAIPGALLDSDSADVPMPLPPPTAFVVEPFVTTEPVQLVRGADGSLVPPPPGAQTYPDAAVPGSLESSLHWLWGGNQWMRVDAVVLGETGRMRCLGPTVRVQQMQEEPLAAAPGSAAAALQRAQQLALEAAAAEAEDEEEAGALRAAAADVAAAAAAADAAAAPLRRQVGSFDLTPPPACLALPEAVRSARVRMEIVADRLALRGVAEISAYMHYETGELVVVDVCTLPDLSPAGLVFKQAAADGEAPLPPAGVFYELIRVAASTPMADGGDALGALGFPELTEEAAEYDYPRDSEYVPYDEQSWGPYEQEPQQWSSST
ncbi:hypothetical protein COHA_000948 [Chlorella ohadii]|uniref:SAP domain-containing protein n=1 Tax=Chlorella ohadii TaxID=2649997 RepID=A0AAD5H972_9CHLO|nr:hypothetical protein COHA_000948 [Chlorella ohadii]